MPTNKEEKGLDWSFVRKGLRDYLKENYYNMSQGRLVSWIIDNIKFYRDDAFNLSNKSLKAEVEKQRKKRVDVMNRNVELMNDIDEQQQRIKELEKENKELNFELKVKKFMEETLKGKKKINTSDVLDYVYDILANNEWHPIKFKDKVIKELQQTIKELKKDVSFGLDSQNKREEFIEKLMIENKAKDNEIKDIMKEDGEAINKRDDTIQALKKKNEELRKNGR